MSSEANRKKRGFSLIELMVTIATLAIVLLGMGIALVDSQRGYNKMYERVHGAVATDSYVAKKVFDNVIRKSSSRRYILGTENLAVFYYHDLTSSRLDRYANFRTSNGSLLVDHGEVDSDGRPQNAFSTMTLARNVHFVDFTVLGACVQMVLRLDDGRERATVTCSAVRHNE